MSLDKILPNGETGESARIKINNAFTEVDKLGNILTGSYTDGVKLVRPDDDKLPKLTTGVIDLQCYDATYTYPPGEVYNNYTHSAHGLIVGANNVTGEGLNGSGDFGITGGGCNVNLSEGGLAMGFGNFIQAEYSMICGLYNNMSGSNVGAQGSIFGGGYNTGSAHASLVVGTNNTGRFFYSIVGGLNNVASGGGVFLLGSNIDSTGADMATIIGHAPKKPVNNNYVFIVGNGDKVSAPFQQVTKRSDAFRISREGLVTADSVTLEMVDSGSTETLVHKGWVKTNYVTQEQYRSSIINTYIGTTLPNDDLGKDNDRYREFPTYETTTIKSGSALEDATDFVFYLYQNLDSTVPYEIKELSISPYDNTIEFFYGSNLRKDFFDVILTVNGTDIPLTVQHSTDSDVLFSYDHSFNTVISNVKKGDPFSVSAIVVQGEYKDFIKYDGKWIIFEHFGRPEVISDYSVTPTRDQLIAAYKLTTSPDWIHNKDFYVKDIGNTKLLLVKYRANGAIDESTAGEFFYEKLTLAK